MQAINKDRISVANDRKSVDKTAAGVAASRVVLKPATTAAKQTTASQRETIHGMNHSHSGRTSRQIPTTSTRSTQSRTPATVVTRSVDDDATAVTKRPPQPPSKLKRPGSVSSITAAADRRRVSAAEQRRPASMDCSALITVRQQPADVRHQKSDSCTNIANVSGLMTEEASTRIPAKGVLKKNDHIAKSYDCITPRCISAEIRNSNTSSSQMHGSSTSLIEMQPRRLVKPYSAINRCSTFGQRMVAPNQNRSTATDCSVKIRTDHASAGSGNRPSLAYQARASELSDLPEVEEFDCDRPASAGGSGRLPSGARNRESDSGLQKSTAKVTQTVASLSVYPDVQQKPTEGYKYRAEYSTFLTAVPLHGENRLNLETVPVASTDSSSNREVATAMIKQDNNDMENSSSSMTRLTGNCNAEVLQYSALKVENFRLTDYDKPANESCMLAARPATLPVETSTVEDVTATASTTDKLSAPDSYVVTYESDNIVVLDREPFIDCLTPDGDVVSTEVRQLLTTLADTVSREGGLSRSLPLSESGYDTWKSSQGSVAVVAACAGSVCVVAPVLGAEQQQRQSDDGTLRICSPSKTFDTQSVEPSSDQIVYKEGPETCQTGGGESSAVFGDGDNRDSESVAFITGPLNGPVLFYSLVSVVCRRRLSSSVTLPAGGRAGRRARGRSGGRHCTASQYGCVPLGRHLAEWYGAWRNELGDGLKNKRSRVRLPDGAWLRNDFGQVVHTFVPLSPSSTIWYRLYVL